MKIVHSKSAIILRRDLEKEIEEKLNISMEEFKLDEILKGELYQSYYVLSKRDLESHRNYVRRFQFIREETEEGKIYNFICDLALDATSADAKYLIIATDY